MGTRVADSGNLLHERRFINEKADNNKVVVRLSACPAVLAGGGRVTKYEIFFAFYTQNRRAFLAPLAALPLGSTLAGEAWPPVG